MPTTPSLKLRNDKPSPKTPNTATDSSGVLYQAASRGLVMNPRLRQVKLEDYIHICKHLQSLAAALAYGLVVEPARRNTPDYILVYACMNWGENLWRNWIVYRTCAGDDLKHLLLINISAYHDLRLPSEFLDRLITELRVLSRG